VGGVVGGLALIAFIGFGIWFVRRKKHNSGAVLSHRDSPTYHSPANYQSPSQSLPNYDYANPTSASPQYNHPPMSSTPRNASQNFSNLPYIAIPQASELASTTARPKTPEMR
jgi:hypothetical protein